MRVGGGRSELSPSAREINSWIMLIRALNILDFADQQLGRSGVGAHTREALEISMAHGDAPQESVARANLGVLAFYAGRWAEAVEWLTTSSRVAIDAGNDFGAAETDLTYADILIHQGRLDDAERILSTATRILRASGIEDFAAHAQVLQARIHLARGELDAAREQAGDAVNAYREMGSAVDALEASLVLAEVAVEAGDSSGALTTVDEAQQATHGEGASLEARSQVVRGRALLALDRIDEAGAAIDHRARSRSRSGPALRGGAAAAPAQPVGATLRGSVAGRFRPRCGCGRR